MSTSKVYVGNLAWATDENALGSHFNNVGSVKEAVVMRSEGRSRGFGFVTFTSADEARRAIDTMNDTELHGRRIRVNVASQQMRATGMGGGDQSTSNARNLGGYHYQAGGYQAPPYPARPYNGYPPPHPSQPGGPFMMGGYGANPAMGYPGGHPYDGDNSMADCPPDQSKPGNQTGGPYMGQVQYPYPPSGYGQQPY